MKKHLLKFFVSLTVALLFVGFNSQCAFAEMSGDWEYEIESSEIRIIKYHGDEEDVTVPKEIDGKPVTIIGGNAFSSIEGARKTKSITMESVITIEGGGAFAYCGDLVSVSMPNVTSIGEDAFQYCSGLTSLDMPNVTEIVSNAFFKCSNLASVNMPNVTKIGMSAFANSGLTSVTIPDSMVDLFYDAFSDCIKLQSVTVLSDTVDINQRFERCENISTIYCHAGSKAEAYAKSKGIQCILLSSNPTTPEEHNWVWQTITEPTEYTDGMEGYVCTICGATKDTVTLPSAGVFMKNRYNQVKNAKAGETVVLEMGPWHSLSKGFMEEIAKRRDVTFVIHFIYEGKKYEVVIPAGRPLVLDPSIDWYGPLKQNEMFGMKEIQ